MLNFEYYTPTKVIFGKGVEANVGEAIKSFGGKKVLIHYGGKSVLRSGLLDRVKGALEASDIPFVELGGVVPNPHLGKVYEGIRLAKENGVDFILAVGGGSVIDSSKAIALGLGEPDSDVWELFTHMRTAKACLPVGVILTIAAAGSEMSNGRVISREDTAEKRGYNSDMVRPKFAIMDPELTETLPDYQTASGCADILMHTMERYFTNSGNMEITDSIAEALMRTVIANALILRDDPKNYDARAEVMWASSLSHNGLTGCGTDGGDWSTHMMEHEMGGKYDVTHGAGLAAIWGSWARYVYKDCLPRFYRFAVNVMGVTPEGSEEETAVKGIEAMESFYREIRMPTSLTELGITPSDGDMKDMAHSCIAACGGPKGAAKLLDEEDMLKIYKMAR